MTGAFVECTLQCKRVEVNLILRPSDLLPPDNGFRADPVSQAAKSTGCFFPGTEIGSGVTKGLIFPIDAISVCRDPHFSVIRNNQYAKLFRRLSILNQPFFLKTEITPARHDKVIENAQTKNISGFG